MSQGTANPKQNIQNDLCALRRLRSDYIVRVVWSAFSLKKPWVLGSHTAADWNCGKSEDCTVVQVYLSFCWAYILFCLCWSAARDPQAHTIDNIPANLTLIPKVILKWKKTSSHQVNFLLLYYKSCIQTVWTLVRVWSGSALFCLCPKNGTLGIKGLTKVWHV